MTICWFGQITIQTLWNIMMPNRMPMSSVGPGAVWIQKSLLYRSVTLEAADTDDEQTEHDRRGRGPPEPPQRAPRELVERVVARRRIHLRVRGRLHEVEEPQQTHPHDRDDHVGHAECAREANPVEDLHRTLPWVEVAAGTYQE